MAVEVPVCVELCVDFEVSARRFYPHSAWSGTGAVVVGLCSWTVGVLEEVNLLVGVGGEEDVVFGCDGVVEGVVGACGCGGWVSGGGRATLLGEGEQLRFLRAMGGCYWGRYARLVLWYR